MQRTTWADSFANSSALFIISHQAKRRAPQVPGTTGSQVPTNYPKQPPLYIYSEKKKPHSYSTGPPAINCGRQQVLHRVLCFFNGCSLETLVQNNYYCNKAWLQRVAFAIKRIQVRKSKLINITIHFSCVVTHFKSFSTTSKHKHTQIVLLVWSKHKNLPLLLSPACLFDFIPSHTLASPLRCRPALLDDPVWEALTRPSSHFGHRNTCTFTLFLFCTFPLPFLAHPLQ